MITPNRQNCIRCSIRPDALQASCLVAGGPLKGSISWRTGVLRCSGAARRRFNNVVFDATGCLWLKLLICGLLSCRIAVEGVSLI
jgi:hypothetical protein